MMQTKTTDYQITDYGIENADCFQGHGTAFTRYEHCTLGCGDCYRDALEDALEQAAQTGYDVEIEVSDSPTQPALNSDSAWEYHCQHCEEEDHENCESNLYYYVGLRWN